ncbi:hypothetical protein V6N13_026030 [Hibiscus sabdariffa]
MQACKDGFKAGCRSIICLDGCHLKGYHGGHLLTAIGIDANDCIYPIAFAAVESECHSSWCWSPSASSFTSDPVFHLLLPPNGLVPLALAKWFCLSSSSSSRYSIGLQPHVPQMDSRDRTGFYLMMLLLRSFGRARSSLVFYVWLALLGEDLDLNNSYHISFMSDRQKGLKEALAEYFPYSEHRFCVRHLYNNFKGKHKGNALKDSFWKAATSTYMREFQVALAKMKSLSPQAFEWLKNVDPKFWSKSHFSTRSKCGMLLNSLCESFNKVACGAHNQYGVNLEAYTCSCRKRDLTGIPCPHAISVILMREQRLKSYMDDCYKTKTQQAIYSHMIHPVRGPNQRIPHESSSLLILPPPIKRPPGRPHKNRRKEADETTNPNAKVSRKGLIMKCKKCGGCGHNVRTCKGKVGGNRFVHSQTQASTETRQPKLPVKRRFCGTTKECATTTTAPTQEAPQVQQPSAIQVVGWMIGSQESSISHCTPNVATSTRNDQ